MDFKARKCLIAYFSRRGKNYVGGDIVSLPVGNTEVVANMIKQLTGGDFFEIRAVAAYPEDYEEATEVAKRELGEKARPGLTGRVENMGSYEVIFLGYPNWWGTMPMPVFTFLESHDLSGKTIVPFCTHEGSGMGGSERDLAKACPGSTILKGLAIRGSEAGKARNAVGEWLDKLR